MSRKDEQIQKGLTDIQSDLIRLDTKLSDHQEAFEKHEMRDDKRFNGLSNDFKEFRQENRIEHQMLRSLINALQIRLALMFGVGIAAITIVDWVIQVYK